MTRQQRRKLEKDKLKGKSSLPTMFGMYYKDNSEEGFNLVVNEFDVDGKEIIERFMRCFNGVQSCYRKEIKGVLNNEMRYKDGLKSLTKDVKHNLELGIENWNKIQNINSRDKGLTYKLELDFSNDNFCRIVFHIMYGIYFLVQQGLIVDDNYNGFMFMNKTLNGTVTHI